MSTTYTTSSDFAAYELANLIATFGEGIPADFNLQVLFDRCRDAGLIVWDDAYDEAANVERLDYQGFRWATDEAGVMEEASFWDIVTDMIESK